ncbi:hypothetical protein C5E02_13470 [Rathayibacter rathayi]|uniref:hypothetical protein n=1 Tax=Rathayibacter rathayi TaxID=33887 RepID=UPI000BD6FB76|nr:hypothetical protein [Rathayibacter rathayi]MWV74594.1 hypothetical protein [Rathayibacter rathayi NCPPB 2980 = VKM Ac-1601]AZZ50123.1 hypothetical protein C1O28_13780 [Rathayibacter rathayi]PPF49729.1 hypothetical protein C5C08_06670 [Rathayibacter rathayi]PPG65721.1 hypothetical protein C5C16_12655 [Rathayibacter rathayi]PPG76112.1 hypothetical protein C5C15_11600 [Rathayibacter rathayi]
MTPDDTGGSRAEQRGRAGAAVRGMIRRAGDMMGGVIMGRCTLDDDVSVPGGMVRIDVTVDDVYPREERR